jgi:hypothetical protein
VQWDELAHEERRERLLGCPAGLEDPLLGADECDFHTLRPQVAQLGEVIRVRACVRNHEVGLSERMSIDRFQRSSRQ